MSDTVIAAGFARITRPDPAPGMITLRADLGDPAVAGALRGATGCGLPALRRMVRAGGMAVAWMSPDEVLILCPRADTDATLAALSAALAGTHHLAADVSDARAMFRIHGPRAAEVVMKLCPVDLAALAPDELRRTRAAQVACALWRDGDGFALVAFASVAGYVVDLLTHASLPGSELFA